MVIILEVVVLLIKDVCVGVMVKFNIMFVKLVL